MIRAKTASSPFNLSTKLTGAGGGGCAVTLIPDGKRQISDPSGNIAHSIATTDMSEETLASLTQSLRDDGFEPYLTSVGGSGLGVLQSRVTAVDVRSREDGETNHIPLRKAFQSIDATGLEAWAERTGEWIFT